MMGHYGPPNYVTLSRFPDHSDHKSRGGSRCIATLGTSQTTTRDLQSRVSFFARTRLNSPTRFPDLDSCFLFLPPL